MKLLKGLVFLGCAVFGTYAVAAEEDYLFKLNFQELYWFDGQSSRSVGSYEAPTKVMIQGARTTEWIDFGSDIFIHTVCSRKANPSFPEKFSMNVGATTAFSLRDDLFTRVRSAKMFVKVESLDPATGEIKISAACDWQYTGGGGGSLEISGIAIKK